MERQRRLWVCVWKGVNCVHNALSAWKWVRGKPVNGCKERTLDYDQLLYLDTEHKMSLSNTQQHKAERAHLHINCIQFFF